MNNLWLYLFLAASACAILMKIRTRLILSKAKHPSLRGHSRISRLFAAQVPRYEYDEGGYFQTDDAPADVVKSRQDGFMHLAKTFALRFAKTLQLSAEMEPSLSDMQFTAAYRVPFQYSGLVRCHLKSGSFLASSAGVTVTDLDGNTFYDLTGSYGVNVSGYDVYKGCIERGVERVKDLGPVLGSYHPVIAYNVQRLKEISGLDEVSFHMSGTEAVMQAVRLAQYHTGRSHIVRFCGTYHGWWGDVQPGIGNPRPARDTYTLKDMHEDSLRVLRTRKNIACVLVNPLNALHPNASAPSDGSLLDSSRTAAFNRAEYTQWLVQLREVCTARGIVLIFDEVFVGFRLAMGGAQEYFGVKADLVTYGKSLGGGLPVGVVCGRKDLMKRFRDDRPADVCFARGTFNSHPYVMAAMNEWLMYLETDSARTQYSSLDQIWNQRADRLNAALAAAGCPVKVANLSSIFTVCYSEPARYNWMLQYFLRAEGLALSWVGTGRLIFSLNYSDADFDEVTKRFVAAAVQARGCGFLWSSPHNTNKAIRRRILRELIRRRLTGKQPMSPAVAEPSARFAPNPALPGETP